jgi:hypothetical protein
MACKDYGAIGNRVTDDTSAIRNALSACKCVYFSSGTYLADLTSDAFL